MGAADGAIRQADRPGQELAAGDAGLWGADPGGASAADVEASTNVEASTDVAANTDAQGAPAARGHAAPAGSDADADRRAG